MPVADRSRSGLAGAERCLRLFRLAALLPPALGLPTGAAQAQERLCVVSTGSWASGNFPGVSDCRAGDALAVLLPAEYPLMVAIGRFCDLSRPVATDRITDANGQTVGSFVCTYAGSVRPLPRESR